MEYTQIITTGPFVDDKDHKEEGYYYRIKEIWGGEFNGGEDCYYWAIHPDGTCTMGYDGEVDRYYYEIKGTVDKSMYEEIVRQMENLEKGWKEILVWDEETEWAQWG